jgi:hypothetical protein
LVRRSVLRLGIYRGRSCFFGLLAELARTIEPAESKYHTDQACCTDGNAYYGACGEREELDVAVADAENDDDEDEEELLIIVVGFTPGAPAV